jgi:hypothetical protein
MHRFGVVKMTPDRRLPVRPAAAAGRPRASVVAA